MRITKVLNEKIERIIEENKERERRTKQRKQAAVEVVKGLFRFYDIETDDLNFSAGDIDHLKRIKVYISPKGFRGKLGWTYPYIEINFNELPTLDEVSSALTNPERWIEEERREFS